MTILNKCVADFYLSLYLHYIVNILLPTKRKNKASFPCFLYIDLSQDEIDAAEALGRRLIKPEKF